MHHLVWEEKPVALLLPGLLFVDLVPVGLRQVQEPPDGAQVLPKCTVLGVGALFPSEQLAQPALQEQMVSCLSSSRHSTRTTKQGRLAATTVARMVVVGFYLVPGALLAGLDLGFLAFRGDHHIISTLMRFT